MLRNVIAGAGVVAGAVASAGATGAQSASVTGTLTVLDRGNRAARDVGDAVVWLERADAPRLVPDTFTVITEDKEFRPRITVIPVGSVIQFPNNDPFNHNVFSLSETAPFDLGSYGRRRSRGTTFSAPGIVNVYCNVHASMSALVVVLATPWYARPDADGSFTLSGLPLGRYTLKAWHERAGEILERPVRVPRGGVRGLALELDARRFERREHLNKYGRPYRATGRRY